MRNDYESIAHRCSREPRCMRCMHLVRQIPAPPTPVKHAVQLARSTRRAILTRRRTVLRHRVVLNFQAEAEGISSDNVVAQVMKGK
jgi:hypothetical protein